MPTRSCVAYRFLAGSAHSTAQVPPIEKPERGSDPSCGARPGPTRYDIDSGPSPGSRFVRERTTLSLLLMLHVRPSLDHDLHLGRKWVFISSNTKTTSDTVISSMLKVPSGMSGYSFKLTTTSSSSTPGLPDDVSDDVLYGKCVIWVDITPHDMPPLPSLHQF